MSKLRKADLLLPLPRFARQESSHIVLRTIVDGAACAAIKIEFEDKKMIGMHFRVAECDAFGGRAFGLDLDGPLSVGR